MKKAGPIIACVIIVLGFFIAAFAGGRMMYLQKSPHALAKSDSLSVYQHGWVTANVTEAYMEPICTIKHRFIHIFPITTEYYYLALTEDAVVIVVRADKNWVKENFDSEGLAKNGSIKVEGYVRDLSGDAKLVIGKELKYYILRTEKEQFLDANGFRNGLLLMILGLVPLVGAVVIAILYRTGSLEVQLYETRGKVLFAVFMALLLGELLLMRYVFSLF